MKKLLHILLLSCRKATLLIEKRMVTRLSLKESVQLKLHKSMCDACIAYEKHSRKIDELLSSKLHDHNNHHQVVSNPKLKERINKLID
jgi:hypothetical protein